MSTPRRPSKRAARKAIASPATGADPYAVVVESFRSDMRVVLEAVQDCARKSDMDARFDAVDARFDGVDARFEAVDARLDAVDARFDAVDARFDTMDARFDTVNSAIAELTGTVSEAVGLLRTQVLPRVDRCERDISELTRRIAER